MKIKKLNHQIEPSECWIQIQIRILVKTTIDVITTTTNQQWFASTTVTVIPLVMVVVVVLVIVVALAVEVVAVEVAVAVAVACSSSIISSGLIWSAIIIWTANGYIGKSRCSNGGGINSIRRGWKNEWEREREVRKYLTNKHNHYNHLATSREQHTPCVQPILQKQQQQ